MPRPHLPLASGSQPSPPIPSSAPCCLVHLFLQEPSGNLEGAAGPGLLKPLHKLPFLTESSPNALRCLLHVINFSLMLQKQMGGSVRPWEK